MDEKYEGLSDQEIIGLICEEYGCLPDSHEAGVRLLIAKGIMNEKGEIRNDDGTVSQY